MADSPSRLPSDPASSTREPIRASYDWGSTAPSKALVLTAAVATNSRPTELPALYARVDPEALDALIGRGSGEFAESDGGDVRIPVSVRGMRGDGRRPRRDRDGTRTSVNTDATVLHR